MISAILVSVILAFACFFLGVLYRDRQYDQEQKRKVAVSGLPIDFNAFPPLFGQRTYRPAWCWKLVDLGCDMTIAAGSLKAMRRERTTCLKLAAEIDDHVYLDLVILPVTEDVAFGY